MDTDTTDTTSTPEQPIQPQSAEQGTSMPEIPEYTPEAAAALDAAYALSEPAPDTSAQVDSPPETSPDPAADPAQQDYTISFPETFAQNAEAQAFNTILAPIAKQSGIDGTAFGKLFADSYAAIETARQQAEWRNRFQQDLDLKKDWGSDYEANMTTARGHIEFLKQKAGLTDADLAVFSSPKGMRALYAMATVHASPVAAGLDMGTITEQTWAKAVMQPGHADHDAFTNPLNPRYKEVNQRWLRANGH